jgi:hypothetical protein
MRYFWIFFLPKSNPYMPLVNFRKKFRSVSFDFCQNLEDRTFTRCIRAYEERISAHAQPAVKCELFYMYNLCWAYAERILSHTEHTRNEFHRMLSILGTDFITCWACAEMLKSWISLPIWIRFLKILCYRPLGPYGFGFCKKSIKKFHACVPLKIPIP